MGLQSVLSRMPLIKFIGARLPRPNFNRDAFPPVRISANLSNVFASPAKATSIGPVGSIPRGSGIDQALMPLKFRRPIISQEECDAINAGGSYGL